MISTTILMPVGVDQTGLHPASADRREMNGISFAQSFDERVNGPVEILGKDQATTEVVTALQSVKDEPHVEITNAISIVLPEMKGKTSAVHEGPEYAEIIGGVDRKSVPQQKATLLASQAKRSGLDFETNNFQSPVDVESAIEDSSTSPQDATEPNSMSNALLSKANAEGQSLAPSSTENVVQRGTTMTGKALELVPGKKVVKSQDEAAPTILHRIATTEHPVAVAAEPASNSVAQGSGPMVGHSIEILRTPPVASVMPNDEANSSSAGDLVGNVPIAGKRSLREAFATKDNLARTDVTEEKTAEVDAKTRPTAAGNEAGSAESGGGAEKVPPATTPGSADNVVRTESASGLAISVANAMVPGNTPSDASVMKLEAGEADSHTTGLPIVLREQNSSAGAGGSMDGTPHMLTATPTALEVGIQNGIHGWLKVRAEMTEVGVVNASVSASSVSGREMLHRELPALTSYLQSEKVAVNAIVVHPTAIETRGLALGREGGSGGQMQHGGNDGGRHQKSIVETAPEGADEATSYESLNGIDDQGTSPLGTYVGGGSWLSVRA